MQSHYQLPAFLTSGLLQQWVWAVWLQQPNRRHLFIFDAAFILQLKWAISEAPDDKSAAAAHSREGGSG